MFKTVAAALVALALTACGGGGDSSSTSVQAVAIQRTVLIEAYGDSTVTGFNGSADAMTDAGWGPLARVNVHSEEAVLQSLLRAQFGAGVTVANMGIGGTTLSDLLHGSNFVPTAWAQQMAASSAQVVTLKYGINDAFATSHDAFTQQLSEAIRVAQAAGKVVVLETSNPIDNGHNADLLALVEAERAIAKARGIALVDHFDKLSARADWKTLLADGTHPTDAGYEILGNDTFPTLAAVVRTLL